MDILKEFLYPIFQLILNYFYVVIAVVPQATWDMRDKSQTSAGIKKPVSQSAAIVIMNISINPIQISDAGICFKNGKTLILQDFNLPVEIRARDRQEFVLNPETFAMLKKMGLDKIKYFYLEDSLFHKFKAYLSKKDKENLLKNYYFQPSQL